MERKENSRPALAGETKLALVMLRIVSMGFVSPPPPSPKIRQLSFHAADKGKERRLINRLAFVAPRWLVTLFCIATAFPADSSTLGSDGSAADVQAKINSAANG